MSKRFFKTLEKYAARLTAHITFYQDSKPVQSSHCQLDGSSGLKELSVGNSRFSVFAELDDVPEVDGAYDIRLTWKLIEGSAEDMSVALKLGFNRWSRQNYVLVPAAMYNGNRCPVYKTQYPPIQTESRYLGADAPSMINDIPRLSLEGRSRVQFHSGDMATPAFAFQDAERGRGFLAQTLQWSGQGETGIAFSEEETGTGAELTLSQPGVNEEVKYSFCEDGKAGITASYPSVDRGIEMKQGDELKQIVRLYFFECPDIQALYDYFFERRKDLSDKTGISVNIPFSAAWKIMLDTYNSERWVEDGGYYSMGPRPKAEKAWILGWPGMMMHSMLLEGPEETKDRAKRTIDFVLSKTQAPTGFLYASAGGGNCYGDNFRDRSLKNWLLIRRDGDGLFYLVKSLLLLRQTGAKDEIPAHWEKAVRDCADAFVNLWEKYGQLGQFVDADTGEIILGNTASGSMGVGALALCGAYFGEARYISAAEAIGTYYNSNFVAKGITNGGPGEILQAPDSESSYAMTESFVVLYEATGKKEWLERAENMAKQFATWVVSYNYKFPEDSEFRRLGMETTGTVYANVQNKHSAPGICTHAGTGLFRLYLYTGKEKYLELIKEIARSLPQYMSREDRPIGTYKGIDHPAGYMNERVSMCDWEGKDRIGEIFYKNCWCSTSLLMTCAEIPGILVQPDTGKVFAIDHVEAAAEEVTTDQVRIRISNPTAFDAEVKVLCRNSSDKEILLGEDVALRCERIALAPGERKEITFPIHNDLRYDHWRDVE